MIKLWIPAFLLTMALGAYFARPPAYQIAVRAALDVGQPGRFTDIRRYGNGTVCGAVDGRPFTFAFGKAVVDTGTGRSAHLQGEAAETHCTGPVSAEPYPSTP